MPRTPIGKITGSELNSLTQLLREWPITVGKGRAQHFGTTKGKVGTITYVTDRYHRESGGPSTFLTLTLETSRDIDLTGMTLLLRRKVDTALFPVEDEPILLLLSGNSWEDELLLESGVYITRIYRKYSRRTLV